MASDHASRHVIEVDGAPLDAEAERLLEHVTVDDHLRLPDMVVLRFRDPRHRVLEHAGLRIGTQIRVLAAPLGTPALEELVVAEVTGLEAELDGEGTRVLVRGYDRAHRLARSVRTESYRNVTDADVVRAIAARAGLLTGRIDETPTIHRLLSQVDLTDWEFLRARAREIGFVVAVTGGELHFHAPDPASRAPQPGHLEADDPLQLVLGRDVEAFRPRLSSMGQVSRVEVRGWDPARKEAVVAEAAPRDAGPAVRHSRDLLATAFGEHRHVSTDRALAERGEADAVARALAEEIGASWVEADGVAQGNPSLRAGRPVSVGLVGGGFDGRYVLTATRHVFDERGYRTTFTVSGSQERSLLGLASLGATNGESTGAGRRMPGVVSALVSGIEDPDGLGRVKLRFPWLSDSYESDWARVASFDAGAGHGAVFLPEVGDEVLVAFEHGEMRRPYVLAALYNGVDRPDLGGALAQGGTVARRGLRTKAGHRLTFLEGGGARVELGARGALVIEASGDVTIESAGRLALRARRGVEIDGGAGEVTVTGTTIRLN